MSVYPVRVHATWKSEHVFEFESEAEADRFRDAVNGGGSAGIEAIVDAGDIYSNTAELTDFEAS